MDSAEELEWRAYCARLQATAAVMHPSLLAQVERTLAPVHKALDELGGAGARDAAAPSPSPSPSNLCEVVIAVTRAREGALLSSILAALPPQKLLDVISALAGLDGSTTHPSPKPTPSYGGGGGGGNGGGGRGGGGAGRGDGGGPVFWQGGPSAAAMVSAPLPARPQQRKPEQGAQGAIQMSRSGGAAMAIVATTAAPVPAPAPVRARPMGAAAAAKTAAAMGAAAGTAAADAAAVLAAADAMVGATAFNDLKRCREETTGGSDPQGVPPQPPVSMPPQQPQHHTTTVEGGEGAGVGLTALVAKAAPLLDAGGAERRAPPAISGGGVERRAPPPALSVVAAAAAAAAAAVGTASEKLTRPAAKRLRRTEVQQAQYEASSVVLRVAAGMTEAGARAPQQQRVGRAAPTRAAAPLPTPPPGQGSGGEWAWGEARGQGAGDAALRWAQEAQAEEGARQRGLQVYGEAGRGALAARLVHSDAAPAPRAT